MKTPLTLLVYWLLSPTSSPSPSSHQPLNTVSGSSQWRRPRVLPWWRSCRDTQNRSVVPKRKAPHSRVQTTLKTGRPPKRRWWSPVQLWAGSWHQSEHTRRPPESCPHPRAPGRGCSAELCDSQTPPGAPVATCEPAPDETGEHTDAAS